MKIGDKILRDDFQKHPKSDILLSTANCCGSEKGWLKPIFGGYATGGASGDQCTVCKQKFYTQDGYVYKVTAFPSGFSTSL